MDFNNEDMDICDLDESKVCDNCEKCLGLSENDYMEIRLEGVIKESDDLYKEYEEYEVFSKNKEGSEEDVERDYEFIEDHKELKEEYDKNIIDILKGK